MKEQLTLFIILFVFVFQSMSQNFMNGDFESNTATADLINLANPTFNSSMADSEAFGWLGNVDIIQSSAWGGGGAQNGTWYIALTGGGSDQVSMELDAPVLAGQTYSMSFWDRRDAAFVGYTVDIGVSTSSTDIGEVVYTTTSAPVVNVWTERVFSFTAPFDADYITIQQSEGSTGDWVNVDNFQILCDVDVDLGEDINTCEGESVILNAGVEDGIYEWQDGSTDSTFTVTENGLYSVTVETESCTVSDLIIVTFVNIPDVELIDEVTSCIDEPVELTVNSDVLVLEYDWSTGDSTQSITVDEPGIYTVELNNLGCLNMDSVEVSFVDYPIIDLGEDLELCVGETAILNPGGSANEYLWQDGNTNSTYPATEEGLYSVEVSNGYCSSEDEVELFFEVCDVTLELPNIFTPNGDDWNNLFQPIHSENVFELNFKLFNRWGTLIFETNELDILWDGKRDDGEAVSSGTYYYIATFSNEIGDEKILNGPLTVIRD